LRASFFQSAMGASPEQGPSCTGSSIANAGGVRKGLVSGPASGYPRGRKGRRMNGSPHRRHFLRAGLAAWLSGGLCRAAPRRPRSCILVYLLGGPSHLDTFDLKPDAPAEVRGPFRPIATSVPGLRICEHLPRLARLARSYALVRSVTYNNHNHTPMIFYTLTGRPVERPGEDNDVRPPLRT